MISQEFARMLWIRRHPRNGIEFMITQNALRRTRFNHPAHQSDRLHLLGSSVDQVAYESRSALRMTPNRTRFGIAEVPKECDQFVALAMDVADDVKRVRQGVPSPPNIALTSRRDNVLTGIVHCSSPILRGANG